MLAEAFHVGPRAQGGIDGCVVDDGETVVGRVGVEGQDVNAAKQPGEARLAEVGQGAQRRLGQHTPSGAARHLVAIGNQEGIALGEREASRARTAGWAASAKRLQAWPQAGPGEAARNGTV